MYYTLQEFLNHPKQGKTQLFRRGIFKKTWIILTFRNLRTGVWAVSKGNYSVRRWMYVGSATGLNPRTSKQSHSAFLKDLAFSCHDRSLHVTSRYSDRSTVLPLLPSLAPSIQPTPSHHQSKQLSIGTHLSTSASSRIPSAYRHMY